MGQYVHMAFREEDYYFKPINLLDVLALRGLERAAYFEATCMVVEGENISYYLGVALMGSNRQVSAQVYWTHMYGHFKDDPIKGPLCMAAIMELE